MSLKFFTTGKNYCKIFPFVRSINSLKRYKGEYVYKELGIIFKNQTFPSQNSQRTKSNQVECLHQIGQMIPREKGNWHQALFLVIGQTFFRGKQQKQGIKERGQTMECHQEAASPTTKLPSAADINPSRGSCRQTMQPGTLALAANPLPSHFQSCDLGLVI